jgi:3D (Asp-Asp-Asp) domain-containing protein
MRPTFILLCTVLSATSAMARADAVSELVAFSVFDKIDINELASSDVKTMHGPPMSGRFLSVQSVYVAPGSPAQQIEALKQWDPTKHRELKVFLHGDLSTSPTAASFVGLKNAPSNSSVSAFVTATQKLGSDLQISKEDAKKYPAGAASDTGGAIPAAVVSFWSEVLAARAKSFVSGGTAAQPPYDHGSETVQPNDELNSLLKQQDKIRKQFAGLLGETGIGRGASSLTPELYWELLDVDDQGVVTLGASYFRAGSGGTYQSADVLYYANGGYYVALTLYQMWPVTAGGKASTLVWRGDMISSASLASLHGVERLGSESAMMKDISKAVTLFRKDSDGR